jgi:tetratricopeptide (TPR) repeat protein
MMRLVWFGIALAILLYRGAEGKQGGSSGRKHQHGLSKKVSKKKSVGKTKVVIEASPETDTKPVESAEEVTERQIDTLRIKARKFLSRKDYERAALCYAGILQLNEGKGGPAALEMRRRCCLTLAECEIKVGRLDESIALCTEVIDETSTKLESLQQRSKDENDNETDIDTRGEEEGDLKNYLGKAHYRRGVSLARLGLPELALLDLQEAHLNLPEDEATLDRIVAVQAQLDAKVMVETEAEAEAETEGRSSSDGCAVSSGSSSRSGDGGNDPRERLLDVVERAQLTGPRMLSEKSLALLCTEETASPTAAAIATPSFSIPGMGDMGGIGDLLGGALGSGGGGVGAAGGMGGGLAAMMGGMAGGKGGAGGKLPSLDGIAAMLPMLGGMAGLSPDTIAAGKEIITALSHVGKVFFALFKAVAPYKDLVVAVIAAVLIYISTR